MTRIERRLFPVLVVCFVLPIASALAQDSGPEGRWIGAVQIPGTPLGVAVSLTEDPAAGTIDIPSQNARELTLDPVEIDGDSVTFTIFGVPGNPTFSGALSDDGASLNGTFTQGPGSFPFELTRAEDGAALELQTAVEGDVDRIEGVWSGRLNTGGTNLGLILRVTRTADQGVLATLDSPDQGATGMVLDTVVVDGDSVRFTQGSLFISFQGTLDAAGDSIDGTFMQMNAPMPLILKRGDGNAVRNRPQNPERPFPYDEIEVAFENAAAGVRLAGTLTRPSEGGPFAGAVLITGSGSQDRDETLLGHKPFLVLSDYLTRRGLAVLRVDDRGVGGSGPATPAATTRDFAGDVAAALDFLRSRDDIDPERIGLIGHSEGGVIASMVAADDPRVAFVVMMAGTGIKGEEILYLQAAGQLRRAGAGPDTIQRDRALRERIFEIIGEESDVPVADCLQSAREELFDLVFRDSSAEP